LYISSMNKKRVYRRIKKKESLNFGLIIRRQNREKK
jgi:hypothetical protein